MRWRRCDLSERQVDGNACTTNLPSHGLRRRDGRPRHRRRVGRPGGPRRPSRVGSQGSGTGGHVGSRVDPDRSRQGASGLRPHDDGATDRPALHGRWPGDRDRLRHPERHQQLPRGQPRPHRPHDGRHRCGAICHEPRRHPDERGRHGRRSVAHRGGPGGRLRPGPPRAGVLADADGPDAGHVGRFHAVRVRQVMGPAGLPLGRRRRSRPGHGHGREELRRARTSRSAGGSGSTATPRRSSPTRAAPSSGA